MKKGLKILLTLTTLLAMPLTLASCGETSGSSEPQTSMTDENQDMVNAALQQLNVPSSVEADFTLTTTGMGGVTFVWTSDNAAIAINGGQAAVTRSTEADVTVNLTATATKGGATGTRSFVVTVKKLDVGNYELSTVAEAKQAEDGAKLYIKGIIGQEVPYSTGADIFASSLYIVDTTGALYVFSCANLCKEVEAGDEVIISGTKATHKEAAQLTYPTLEIKLGSGKNVPLDSVIEGETVTSIMGMTGIAGNMYKLTGTFKRGEGSGDSGSYVYYRLTDSAGKYINIYWDSSKAGSYTEVPQFTWLDQYNGQEITVAFVINSSNSSGVWRGHILHIYA